MPIRETGWVKSTPPWFLIRKWFDGLSLKNKIHLQIQPLLIALLSVTTFFIYQQVKSK